MAFQIPAVSIALLAQLAYDPTLVFLMAHPLLWFALMVGVHMAREVALCGEREGAQVALVRTQELRDIGDILMLRRQWIL